MTPPASDEAAPATPNFARLRWLVRLNRHPSAILLLVQLTGLMIYPLLEQTPGGTAMLRGFGVIVLGLAVWMVQRSAGRAWISAGIAAPVLLIDLAESVLDLPALRVWSAALEALFYFYAAGCLIRYMLADRRATSDELFAAGATFTLLAWAFTYLFVLCQLLQPDAFGGAVNPGAPRSWTELLFMSFVLLSSTGIGDVIPLSGFARALASLEIFTGVMYLALVVSRLIGLTILRRGQ
ncbi:ion channel [Dokdonella ginsengisoli]|uniref:Ion channel n=1 Tax=Dokdonella ginsengisoli TaxID=363846 RepID=A0ABV9QQ81_9GAMM